MTIFFYMPSNNDNIRNQTRQFYNEIAVKFSGTRDYWWKEFDFIKEYIQEKDVILDFGCGNGRLVDFLKKEKKASYYTGIDIASSLVAIAQKKHPKEKFLCIDGQGKLPFADNSFDGVFAIAVFHHFDPTVAQAVLSEIKRVTKPNGRLVLSVWYLWNYKYIKYLFFSFIKGNFDFSGQIPFKVDGKKYQRFCFWWRKSNLQKLVLGAGFRLLKTGYTLGKQNRKRNIFLVAEKI